MALPFLGTPESIRLAQEEQKRQNDIERQDTIETIRDTISATLPISIGALTGFLTKDPVLALGAGLITDAVSKRSKRVREERVARSLDKRQRRAAADLLVESGQFQNRREALAEIERQRIQQELDNSEKEKDALVQKFGLQRKEKEQQQKQEEGTGEPQAVVADDDQPLALETTLANIDNNISAVADLLVDNFADEENRRERELAQQKEMMLEASRLDQPDVGEPTRDREDDEEGKKSFLSMIPLIGGLTSIFGGLATAVGGVASALTGFIAAGGAFSLFSSALSNFKNRFGMGGQQPRPRQPLAPGGAPVKDPTKPPSEKPKEAPKDAKPTQSTKAPSGALSRSAKVLSRAVPIVAAAATVANVADAAIDASGTLELPEDVDPNAADRIASGFGGLVEALTFGLVDRTTVAKAVAGRGSSINQPPQEFDDAGDEAPVLTEEPAVGEAVRERPPGREVMYNMTEAEAEGFVTRSAAMGFEDEVVKNNDGTFSVYRTGGAQLDPPQATGQQLSDVSRDQSRPSGGNIVTDASQKTTNVVSSNQQTTNLQSAPLQPENRDIASKYMSTFD